MKKTVILLVEDNPLHQQSSLKALEELGFTYEIANNGAEALTKMQKASFDLILMDIDMPVMNGIEATEKIRKIYGTETARFALSAYNQVEMKEAYPDADFEVYLNKPLSTSELSLALAEQKMKSR